jgi:hypothetical protein
MSAATIEVISEPQLGRDAETERLENVSQVQSVNSRANSSAGNELRYQRILGNPRFFQFAHIPERIIRCLDFYGIDGDKERSRAALSAYYLFIGVTDDAIDGADDDVGETILARLENPFVSFNEDVACSDAEFLTEVLKLHFPASTSTRLRSKFRTLYRITLQERRARTMRAFVKRRRLLGSVTADISYLLVRDYLLGDASRFRALMRDVGAVGCLVDSVIDARSDQRAGLLAFRPSPIEWLFLYAQTFALGMRILWKHPRLVRLFFEAITDNVYDRRRSVPVQTGSD